MTQTTNYREVKAVSNSSLREFETNFLAFRDWWIKDIPITPKDTGSLTLGSAVDLQCTRFKDLDQVVYINEGIDPKPQIANFCKNLYLLKQEQGDLEEKMQKAYDQTKFGRDTFESVKERFKVEGLDYYNTLVKGEGKVIFTKSVWGYAEYLVKKAREGEFTKDILNLESLGDIEVLYQLEIYDEYDLQEDGYLHVGKTHPCKIPVKGALDKVVIDHRNKIIFPYDIKTSANLLEFKESYIKYRYFRQASYYSYLLSNWANRNNLTRYKIAPFVFIVISTNSVGSFRYRVSDDDLISARYGGKLSTGEYIPGWEELLNDICWHTMTNKWEYPKEVYKHNGELSLNVLF